MHHRVKKEHGVSFSEKRLFSVLFGNLSRDCLRAFVNLLAITTFIDSLLKRYFLSICPREPFFFLFGFSLLLISLHPLLFSHFGLRVKNIPLPFLKHLVIFPFQLQIPDFLVWYLYRDNSSQSNIELITFLSEIHTVLHALKSFKLHYRC